MLNHSDEVEGVNHRLPVSQKLLSVRSCLRRCARNHLHVCQVNVGEEEARQIVCGAPNVRRHQGYGGSSSLYC